MLSVSSSLFLVCNRQLRIWTLNSGCFANYETFRGNITITSEHVQFFKGVHLKRNEAPIPFASIEMRSIAKCRKIQAWQAAEGLGLQGVGDGLELVLDDGEVCSLSLVLF